MRIHVVDIESGKTMKIDESPEWMNHGGSAGFEFDWSPDSRWVSYSRPTGDANNAIFLYDTQGSKLTRATTGYLNDTQPAFDPDGKYLYYASDREFAPVYGGFDNSWTYPNPTRLVAVPLRKDVQSPLYARNDYEDGAEAQEAREKKRREEGRSQKDETPSRPPK